MGVLVNRLCAYIYTWLNQLAGLNAYGVIVICIFETYDATTMPSIITWYDYLISWIWWQLIDSVSL